MIKSKNQSGRAKMLVSLLAVCVLAANALEAKAVEAPPVTDITGITGNNGVFNINPSEVHGNAGFRQYENFKLSEGDVANLIFKYGEQNVSKFVNLVDNTININGLVNTMRDGNFYNGQAIFISPNGMVVGGSGVLNVGSLAVYTPTQEDYNSFKAKPDLGLYKMDQGAADVEINGKVIARDGITLSGRNVTLGAEGALLSGVNSIEALSSKAQADKLFNELVNTSSASSASSFVADNGKIVIKSTNAEGSVNVDGTVKNVAENGKVEITNKGSNGLGIGGKIDTNGNTLIVNHNGNLDIDSTAVVNGKNRINITNHGNALNINGTVNNDNVLKVWATGEGGTNLNGKIVNNKDAVIQNDQGTFKINGEIDNKSALSVISNGSGMEVGNDANIKNTNSLKMWNTGANGIKVAGTFDNDARAVIQNYEGNMEISGNISNADTLNLINNGSKFTITDTATIANNDYTGVLNTGDQGMTVNGKVNSNAGNIIFTNQKGDMSVGANFDVAKDSKVNITNHGNSLKLADSTVVNNNGAFKVWATGANGADVKGQYNGSGDMVIQSDNGDMTVSAKFVNDNGTVRLTNKGNGMTLAANSSIKNNGTGSFTVTNTGANGVAMNGEVVNAGNMLVSNTKGDITIAHDVDNSGKLSYTSKEGINLNEGVTVTNNKTLTMLNNGSQGMNLDGKIVNNGSATLTNKAGNFNVNGTVENKSGKVSIVNKSGKFTLAENGSLDNSGTLSVWNTGSEGADIKGTVANAKGGSVVIKNDEGKLSYTGTLTNNGKTTMSSYGTGAEFAEGSTINNDGNLSLINYGDEGLKYNGNLQSQGTSYFTNKAGSLDINGDITGVNNKIYLSSDGGIVIGADSNINNQGSLSVLNNGANGLTVNGILSNNGRTIITSNDGDITVNGTIANSGDKINITNHGQGLYVNEQGKVQSDGVLKIWSTGDGGVHISGTVENTSANSAIQSDNGSMNISGTVNNNGDHLYITNHGNDLTVTENAKINNRGNISVWNTSNKDADIKGEVKSTGGGRVIISNDN